MIGLHLADTYSQVQPEVFKSLVRRKKSFLSDFSPINFSTIQIPKKNVGNIKSEFPRGGLHTVRLVILLFNG